MKIKLLLKVLVVAIIATEGFLISNLIRLQPKEFLANAVSKVRLPKTAPSAFGEAKDYFSRFSSQTNEAILQLGLDIQTDAEGIKDFAGYFKSETQTAFAETKTRITNDAASTGSFVGGIGNQIKHLVINFRADVKAPYLAAADVIAPPLNEQKNQADKLAVNFWNGLADNVGMLDKLARGEFKDDNASVFAIARRPGLYPADEATPNSGKDCFGCARDDRQYVVNGGDEIKGIVEIKGNSKVLGIATSAVDPNYINQLIDSRLNQYIAEGKLKGNNDNYNRQIFAGPNGMVQNGGGQTTSVIGGAPIVSYYPAVQQNGFSGASLAGFTQLSAQSFNSETITASQTLTVQGAATLASLNVSGSTSLATSTISSLTVSGPVTLNGSTTIAGLTVTGLNPGLTEGSVLFQGASAILEDNSNFFWNDSANRLQIANLSVSGNATTTGNQIISGTLGIGTNNPAGLLHLVTESSTSLFFDRYGGAPPNIIFRRANGTIAAPTAVTTDNQLFAIGGRGYGASGFSAGGRAALFGAAAEPWTDTAQGAYLAFTTTANGTASAVERLRIDQNGNVGIGTTSPDQLLTVSRSVATPGDATVRVRSVDAPGVYKNATLMLSNGNGSDSTSQAWGLRSNSQTGSLSFLYSQFGEGLGNERMTISSTGNVGIGTTNPGQRLTIVPSGNTIPDTVTTYSFGVSNLPNTNINLAFGNDASYAYIQSFESKPLQINNAGNNVIFNATAGNVGIGTTSPQAKLHVSTTGQAIRVDNNVDYELYFAGTGSDTNIYSESNLYLNSGTGKLLYLGNGANSQQVTINSGNVGIGTVSPSEKLHVGSGNILLDNGYALKFKDSTGTNRVVLEINSSNNINLGHIGTWGGTAVTLQSNGATIFNNNASEAMRITSSGGVGIGYSDPGTAKLAINGNVGIGTTSPSQKLEVAGSGLFGTRGAGSNNILINGGSSASIVHAYDGSDNRFGLYSNANIVGLSGNGGTLALGSGASQSYLSASLPGVANGGAFAFYTNSNTTTPSVAINLSGNVGIGTTSPVAQLDIKASGSNVGLNVWGSNGANLQNWYSGGGVLRASVGDNGAISINDGSKISLDLSGVSYLQEASGLQMVSGANRDIILSAGASGERMRIKNDTGNVGIGTTSPFAKLAITGSNSSGTGYALLVANSNNTPSFAVQDDGGVLLPLSTGGKIFSAAGVGLSLGSGSATTAFVIDGSNNVGIGIGFAGVTGRLQVKGLDSTSANVALNVVNSSNLPLLYVRNDGNVGIGTTSPAYKLEVNGTLGVQNNIRTGGSSAGLSIGTRNTGSDWVLYNDTDILRFYHGGDKVVIDNSGNVGIGTTSPSQKLSIGSAASGGNVKIGNGWLCVDDNDTCTGATTAGNIYMVGAAITSGADVAENYPTNDSSLEAGDVVAADTGFPIYVSRATSTSPILGIISTKPGVLLNGYKSQDFSVASTVPVALAGRVPVKVTNENGDIKPGDYLTISPTIPGYATKAIYPGYAIGQALENHSNGNGAILVFINKTYFVPKVADMLQNAPNSGLSADDMATLSLNNSYAFNDLVVVNTMYVGKKLVVKEKIETAELVADLVKAKKVEAEQLCADDVCVNKQQLKALLDLLGQQGGQVAGASTQQSPPPVEANQTGESQNTSTPGEESNPPAEEASPPANEIVEPSVTEEPAPATEQPPAPPAPEETPPVVESPSPAPAEAPPVE